MRPLVLPLPPSANLQWVLVRGRLIATKTAKAYKQAIALKALASGMRPLQGPVEVHLEVYRARRRGDLDNFLKVLLDGLKGVAWGDDEQVNHIDAWRFEDKANPRVEIWVQPAVGLKEPS